MKRIAILALIAVVGAAGLAAQPAWGFNQGPMMGPNFNQPGQAAPTTSTIEGKLVFVEGYPAVQAKDKTYLIHMPRFYYYAYTDGIKEGAQVKAEGYLMPTFPGQDKPYFSVTKAIIGAKTYDMAELAKNCGMMGGMMGGRGGRGGPGGGMMGGRGGRGGRW